MSEINLETTPDVRKHLARFLDLVHDRRSPGHPRGLLLSHYSAVRMAEGIISDATELDEQSLAGFCCFAILAKRSPGLAVDLFEGNTSIHSDPRLEETPC